MSSSSNLEAEPEFHGGDEEQIVRVSGQPFFHGRLIYRKFLCPKLPEGIRHPVRFTGLLWLKVLFAGLL
jgi:hypothetical protein